MRLYSYQINPMDNVKVFFKVFKLKNIFKYIQFKFD